MTRRIIKDGADSVSMADTTYRARDGSMFHISAINRDLTSGSSMEFLFSTGDKIPYSNIQIQAESSCEMVGVEGVTTTNNGTSMTIYNMNRNSDRIPLTECFNAPTWSNGSNVATITTIYAGGGTTKSGFGSTAKQNIEWALKKNTKYLVTIKNVSVATTTVNIIIDFSEC